MSDNKEVLLRFDDLLQFRLSTLKEIDFFIAKINNRKKMGETLNKYITKRDFVDKQFC